MGQGECRAQSTVCQYSGRVTVQGVGRSIKGLLNLPVQISADESFTETELTHLFRPSHKLRCWRREVGVQGLGQVESEIAGCT